MTSGSDGGGWSYTPPTYAQAVKDSKRQGRMAAMEQLSKGYETMSLMSMSTGNKGQQELIRLSRDPYFAYGLELAENRGTRQPNWQEYIARISSNAKTEPIEGYLAIGFTYLQQSKKDAEEVMGSVMVSLLVGMPDDSEDADNRDRRRRRRPGEDERDYRRRIQRGGNDEVEGDDPDGTSRVYRNQAWANSQRKQDIQTEREMREGKHGPDAKRWAWKREIRRRIIKYVVQDKLDIFSKKPGTRPGRGGGRN